MKKKTTIKTILIILTAAICLFLFMGHNNIEPDTKNITMETFGAGQGQTTIETITEHRTGEKTYKFYGPMPQRADTNP